MLAPNETVDLKQNAVVIGQDLRPLVYFRDFVMNPESASCGATTVKFETWQRVMRWITVSIVR